MPDVQHFNCKIYAEQNRIDLGDAIPVFHRWIQDQVVPEMLIDIADYGHVPEGPGIFLIAHEANYSLDQRHGRLGLLYNRKAAIEGSTRDKLKQAYTSAVDACRRLEQEPEFRGKLKFDLRDIEFIVNDRLLAPNTEQTWSELRPEFEAFTDEVFGSGNCTLSRRSDPRERFTVQIQPAAARV